MPDDSQARETTDIILYDGVCGLCNRAVRFFLKRDKNRVFRFASLQSPFTRQVLISHGMDPDSLHTFYVLADFGRHDERLLSKSAAALRAISRLGGKWKTFAALARLLPRKILDWGYDLIANHRYALFGKYETCPLPNPADRDRFIE